MGGNVELLRHDVLAKNAKKAISRNNPEAWSV